MAYRSKQPEFPEFPKEKEKELWKLLSPFTSDGKCSACGQDLSKFKCPGYHLWWCFSTNKEYRSNVGFNNIKKWTPDKIKNWKDNLQKSCAKKFKNHPEIVDRLIRQLVYARENFWCQDKYSEARALRNKKISIALRGHSVSIDSRKKISKKNKGKNAWNKGILWDENIKEKIRKSLKGNIPWNKGKRGIYSKETLEKMKKSAKNRKMKTFICIAYYNVVNSNQKAKQFVSEIKTNNLTPEQSAELHAQCKQKAFKFFGQDIVLCGIEDIQEFNENNPQLEA